MPDPDPIDEAFANLAASSPEPVAEGPNAFLENFAELPSADEPAKPDDTPTPTETKPDADTDTDGFPDEPPNKSSESAGNVWKGLKTELKKTKADLRAERDTKAQELAARDTELNELREKTSKLPDLEQKAAFVEEAERKIAILDVKQSREYKQAIEAPLDAIDAAAEIIAKANEVKLTDLQDAIMEADPVKRRELLRTVVADMDDVDKAEVIQMAKDTQIILAREREMSSRAFEARKELEAITKENETKAQEAARKTFETATENSVAELRKRVPFAELTAGETADGVFGNVLTKAKAVNLDTATPAVKAFAAAAGILLPRVVAQYVAAQAEIKTLKARIAGENADLPRVSGDPTPTLNQSKEVDFANFTLPT